jgi:hypothetical protein
MIITPVVQRPLHPPTGSAAAVADHLGNGWLDTAVAAAGATAPAIVVGLLLARVVTEILPVLLVVHATRRATRAQRIALVRVYLQSAAPGRSADRPGRPHHTATRP